MSFEQLVLAPPKRLIDKYEGKKCQQCLSLAGEVMGVAVYKFSNEEREMSIKLISKNVETIATQCNCEDAPKQKKYNLGVCILRVILCFTVIMIHFLKSYSNHFYTVPLNNLMQCATPAFMFLSFFFMEKALSNPTFEVVKKRLVRLVLPFVVWGVWAWSITVLAEILFKIKIADGFRALFWQLVTGHGYRVNAPLWYIADLIWITLLFFVISILLKGKAIFAFVFLAALSITFQYAGWNYELFNDLPFELKYPLGRIAEMIPYATLGYVVSYAGHTYIVSIKKYYPYLLGSFLVFTLSFLGFKRISTVLGFGYSGFLLLVGTTCVATFFYLIPLQWISEPSKKIIVFLGAHTLGIYCMHYSVGNILRILLDKLHVNINSFALCVLIYILCFFLSHMISLLPYKVTKTLVD